MMRMSQPGWNDDAIARSSSRSRRRTRFRMTAPPRRLPVAKPNRVVARSLRTKRPTSRGCVLTTPPSASLAKSPGRESMTSRSGLWLRPSVRPTAACGPLRAARRARADRPASSSGRGTRALWRDAASSVETSACPSGLSVILSISLGRRMLRPLEARKRAERPKARRRVFVPGMIGPAATGCQTHAGFARITIRCRLAPHPAWVRQGFARYSPRV